MMTRILYVEIDLIGVIMLALLYISYGKKQGGDLEQRFFRKLLLTNLVILVIDAITWAIDGKFIFGNDVLHRLVQYAFFFSSPWLGYLWICYCDYKVFEDEKGLRKRRWYYALPLIANLFILLTNHWTGWVFTIDAQRVYHRGSQFILYNLMAFIDVVLALLLPLHRILVSKYLKRRDYIYLILFALFPISCAVIQLLFYSVNLIWISIALALLMIYINVQNRQISTDELTGLNNRRRFNRHMETILGGKRESDSFALLMVDIDSFKLINDTCGHQDGDHALIRTAEILKSCCEDSRFFLARIGGDEFVITIRDCDEDYVKCIVKRIHKAADTENEKNQNCFKLSYSIGYSMLADDGAFSEDRLISLADERMYEEKRSKKAAQR